MATIRRHNELVLGSLGKGLVFRLQRSFGYDFGEIGPIEATLAAPQWMFVMKIGLLYLLHFFCWGLLLQRQIHVDCYFLLVERYFVLFGCFVYLR